MTPQEFEKQLYENAKEDYGICPPPTTDRDGLRILINHFLGENWYVVMPLGHEQVNSEAIYEILQKYPHGEQEKERRRKRIKEKLYDIIDNIFG